MAVIALNVLLGIADRAAWQAGRIINAYDGINTGGTMYEPRVTATDDPDVEIPLLEPYLQVDDTLGTDLYTLLSQSILNFIPNGMIAHFNRVSQPGGWDGYLTTQDARVSDYFNKLYYASEQEWLLANNVFSEGTDLFATATRIAGPAITFLDGVDYGDGAATNLATGGNFAATQLRIVAAVNIGGTDLDLRLSVKDKNDNPTTIDVTMPAGSVTGTVVNVGAASDRFLDVIGVGLVPAGDAGSMNDQVYVYNKKERTVAP